MLTHEERDLLPKLIGYWDRKAKAVAELTPEERMSAEIAIAEARRMLRAAQEINATVADRMRER